MAGCGDVDRVVGDCVDAAEGSGGDVGRRS